MGTMTLNVNSYNEYYLKKDAKHQNSV